MRQMDWSNNNEQKLENTRKKRLTLSVCILTRLCRVWHTHTAFLPNKSPTEGEELIHGSQECQIPVTQCKDWWK